MAQLTHEQAQQVHDALFSLANYLVRLRRRVEKTFKPTDRLFVLACKAQDAIQELRVELHYQSCAHGVGLAPSEGVELVDDGRASE